MVDVIKQGKYKCTCPRCVSELAYSYDEVKDHKTSPDYLGDTELIRGIECPVCKYIIKVK